MKEMQHVCVYFWDDSLTRTEEIDFRADIIYAIMQNSDGCNWNQEKRYFHHDVLVSLQELFSDHSIIENSKNFIKIWFRPFIGTIESLSMVYNSLKNHNVLRIPPENVILIFDEIDSAGSGLKESLRVYYLLDYLGYKIYVASISLFRSLDHYLDYYVNISSAFHVPGTKYDDRLMDYAKSLKYEYHWSWDDIEHLTGIRENSIVMSKKRETSEKQYTDKQEGLPIEEKDKIVMTRCLTAEKSELDDDVFIESGVYRLNNFREAWADNQS